MGSRGPAPHSRRTQDLRGNPGKTRRRGPRGADAVPGEAPSAAAQGSGGEAAPPPVPFRIAAGLPKPVRAEVEVLVAACRGMAIPIRSHHGAILELTASALVELRGLQRRLDREGRSYKCKTEGGGVMIRKHPLLEASGEAWRRAVTGLTKLGLTPADLERVGGNFGAGGGGATPPPPGSDQAGADGPSDGLSEFDK